MQPVCRQTCETFRPLPLVRLSLAEPNGDGSESVHLLACSPITLSLWQDWPIDHQVDPHGIQPGLPKVKISPSLRCKEVFRRLFALASWGRIQPWVLDDLFVYFFKAIAVYPLRPSADATGNVPVGLQAATCSEILQMLKLHITYITQLIHKWFLGSTFKITGTVTSLALSGDSFLCNTQIWSGYHEPIHLHCFQAVKKRFGRSKFMWSTNVNLSNPTRQHHADAWILECSCISPIAAYCCVVFQCLHGYKL